RRSGALPRDEHRGPVGTGRDGGGGVVAAPRAVVALRPELGAGGRRRGAAGEASHAHRGKGHHRREPRKGPDPSEPSRRVHHDVSNPRTTPHGDHALSGRWKLLGQPIFVDVPRSIRGTLRDERSGTIGYSETERVSARVRGCANSLSSSSLSVPSSFPPQLSRPSPDLPDRSLSRKRRPTVTV